MADDAVDPPPAPADTSDEAAAAHAHFEVASTGRSKCRACGTTIAKGEVRLGDKHPNPFAEGETTYWFHALCAAYRRPESFMVAITAEASLGTLPADIATLTQLAEPAAQHPRLSRINKVEQAASGRARCRHCRQAIDKGAWRLSLEIFHDGRFDPMGFIHLSCQKDYFGVGAELTRVLRGTPDLAPEQRAEIQAVLDTSQER
jgi:hypothetical protein